MQQTSQSDLFATLYADSAQLLVIASRKLDDDQVDARAVASELAVVLSRTIEVFNTIERLNQPAASDDDPFAGLDAETRVSLRLIKIAPQKIEDVCFAGALELNRALRELQAARDADALLTAAESAQRKLGRSIRAVLRLARADAALGSANLVDEGPLRGQHEQELQTALAVRRLYADFRRTLRRPENDSSEAVLTALRYAAGAVAILTASPHYVDLRVADRALLRRLRDRLLEWSRAGKAKESGVQLLNDIFTCADLLRDINRRQEVHAHDRQLAGELVRDSGRAPAEWLKDLERLTGLDDTIDAVIVRAKGEPEPGLELVMDAVVRLSYLV